MKNKIQYESNERKNSFEKYLNTLNVNELRYLKKLFKLNNVTIKEKRKECKVR